MKTRHMFLAILVVVLVGAACGDDDATTPTTAAPGGQTDAGSNGGTPTPSASGGFLTLGDETIQFDSARCFLQEQEAAAGGGSILATGQGFGTNSEGVEVSLDFTRFSEESDFAGDDILVDIGDPFSGDTVGYAARVDIGVVSIEGNLVSASGLTFESFDEGAESPLEGAFELNC
ncbi:MAG TPA: hypothetical protein VK960_03490 [Acidimicrobiia bacterium]|nr:hypothetical protein [Acidimicrobiia bacterium]